MNNFEVFVYFVCFALIAGASFAMMWCNMKSINEDMYILISQKHPEAPEPGSPQPGQPGQTPGGQTPGGTGGGGQV